MAPVVTHRLKSGGISAIIISGVMTDLSDRVVGLEMGAEDYLVKPVDPRELIARVRVMMRRSNGAGAWRNEIAHFLAGRWIFAPQSHRPR